MELFILRAAKESQSEDYYAKNDAVPDEWHEAVAAKVLKKEADNDCAGHADFIGRTLMIEKICRHPIARSRLELISHGSRAWPSALNGRLLRSRDVERSMLSMQQIRLSIAQILDIQREPRSEGHLLQCDA